MLGGGKMGVKLNTSDIYWKSTEKLVVSLSKGFNINQVGTKKKKRVPNSELK